MNIGKKLEKAHNLLNQKKDEEALNEYSSILHYDSRNAEALYCRASMLASKSKNDEALIDINASIDSDSSNPMAFCLRGAINYNRVV